MQNEGITYVGAKHRLDINLLRDFLYIPRDSICANALDMLPVGNEIYIISKTNEVSLYRILREQNISSKLQFAYRLNRLRDGLKSLPLWEGKVAKSLILTDEVATFCHSSKYKKINFAFCILHFAFFMQVFQEKTA